MTTTTNRRPSENMLRLLSEVANGRVEKRDGYRDSLLFVRESVGTAADERALGALRYRGYVHSVYGRTGTRYMITDQGRAALQRYWPQWQPDQPPQS